MAPDPFTDLARPEDGLGAAGPPSTASEAGEETEQPSPQRSEPPKGAKDKVRLRFRKDGALRWLSHHDLLRTFERLLRRSGLPFRSTQGFNPHPRIVFALSLPLGVVGRAEIVELELDEQIDPEEVRRRLQAQCPAGLEILSALRIPPNSGVHVSGLCYGLVIPPDRIAATQARIAALSSGEPCWVERSKPTMRRLDIRPFLRDLRLDGASGFLEMDLRLLPSGTARPDEVLGILELADLLEAGAVLERVRLDMADETPPTENTQPGAGTIR
jgi:radical SAM-linked protein